MNRKVFTSQRGYVLLVVLVFLAILLSAGAHFYINSTEHAKQAGGIRDITESVLFAESAMYRGVGDFLFSEDDDTASALPNFLNEADNFLNVVNNVPPLFYITDTSTADTELDQTSPSLLQIVANGEAALVDATEITDQRIETNAGSLTQLRINDLFHATSEFRPNLYVIDQVTGLLVDSGATDWDSEEAVSKAAVWYEVTAASNAAVDVYVQAVAEVDGRKSYMQRIMVTYEPSYMLGSELGALNGSSTAAETGGIDRLRGVDR